MINAGHVYRACWAAMLWLVLSIGGGALVNLRVYGGFARDSLVFAAWGILVGVAGGVLFGVLYLLRSRQSVPSPLEGAFMGVAAGVAPVAYNALREYRLRTFQVQFSAIDLLLRALVPVYGFLIGLLAAWLLRRVRTSGHSVPAPDAGDGGA